MGKNKAYIILGAGLFVAIIAGILTYNWLSGKARTRVNAVETQLVTVAAKDLKWGTLIVKDMVKAVPFLKQTIPGGCFADPLKVEGRTLRYPVKANEPIFESHLAADTIKGGGIAAVIGHQKRAMAVKVDKVIGVSGFIHPGNRVDVMVTLNRGGSDNTPITKTVLENILVLATGPEMEKTGKTEKSVPVDVITLEVSIDEGEKLALAVTEGKLQLALRNLADSRQVITKGMTIPGLLSSLKGAGDAEPAVRQKKPVLQKPKPKQQPDYSYVIKGGSVSTPKSQKGE